jgi:O-antigen/teichoic acid export membrane protein
MSNTKTIARNSGWYGLESIVSSVAGLLASIAVARILGPSKMGYMIYVIWIANVVSTLGGLGIPATTQKYMAEFIGMGDWGTARYIYFRTLFLQMGVATLSTGGILFWVLRDAHSEYKVASVLVVLSIWPAMVNSISAMANAATEELSRNMPASLISTLTYLIVIAAMLVFKWGVTGVGAAYFSMRAVEFLVRLFPTMRRILEWDKVHFQPPGLSRRMMSFAWQSVASMVVALIVWNRSEVVLLKHLCSDIRQIAYYSLAFSMAEQLLLSATIFGSAASVTIFAQYGRDKSRLSAITASTVRYLAFTSIPLHFIAAALAAPALLLLYGHKYSGGVMVATLAPLLCIPKAFIGPVQSLLQSAELQSYVIGATVFAGIIDISIAWYLIPAHGAVGACIGSGAAQVMAVGTMWAVGIHLYQVKLPWLHIAKIGFISTLAALTAHFIAVQLPPLWAILFGGSASLVVLFGLVYMMRVLEPEDQARFKILAGMMPGPIAKPVNSVLLMLIRPEAVEASPINL